MENENVPQAPRSKRSWILGIVVLLAGLGWTQSNWFAAILVLISGLLILPPVAELVKKRWYVNRIWRIVIIVVLLVVATAWGTPTSNTSKVANNQGVVKTSTPPVPELDLRIGYSPNESGFSVPVVTVKNPSSTKWEDCKISLNTDYRANISPILPEASFKELSSESRGYHTIMINNFAKKDGTIFNPMVTKPMTVCATCYKPGYKLNCWEFK